MCRKHLAPHAVRNLGKRLDALQQIRFAECFSLGPCPCDGVGLIADFDNRNLQHVVAGSEPQKDFGLHFQGLRAEGLNDVMTHGMTSSFWMGSG